MIRRRVFRLRAVGAFALTLAVAAPGRAQLRRPTSPVVAPPTSVTVADDALAVDVDPAALAFVSGWALRYAHVGATGQDTLADAGDQIALAGELPLGFGLGFSAGRARPNGPAAGPASGRASIALAYRVDPRLGLGGALRFFGTGGGALTTIDLAATYRPTDRFGASFLVHDPFGPLDLVAASGADLPATFELALTARPFGTDLVTLEASGLADTNGSVAARLFASVAVPRVGALRFAAEVEDVLDAATLRVLVGFDLAIERFVAAGGLVLGDDVSGGPSFYVGAGLRAPSRAGLALPRRAVEVDLHARLGARRILRTLLLLDALAEDPRVEAVVIRLRESGIGMAHAQELREAIERLRDSGRPVLCHLEAATGSELYACTAATRVLVDPAGSLRLMGVAVDIVHLAGLLEKLDVRADFLRIGAWKSAPEQIANRAMSAAAREERERLLDDASGRLIEDLARDREVGSAAVRRWIDEGPFVAEEARVARLVDGTADGRDLGRALSRLLGRGGALSPPPAPYVASSVGPPRRVGVVVIDGSIVDGENVDVPLIGIHQSGARTVIAAIERLAADSSVHAIVLRVDSPGGSALASDQIWRAVRRAARRKPVVASLGAMAASGGYYVASAADVIYADPSTITGSIGIYYGKIDVGGLAARFGVDVEQLVRGRRAGAESLWRAYDGDERAALADRLRAFYRLFLERVATGRGLRVDEVDAVARGRVFVGERAKTARLVDRLGGFLAALAEARRRGSVDAGVPVVVVPSRPETVLDYVLGTGDRESGGARPLAVALGGAEVTSSAFGELAGVLSAMARASASDAPLALVDALAVIDASE